MKRTMVYFVFAIASVMLAAAPAAWAQKGHGHGSSAGAADMKMETREVLVEGVKVTFQIMSNESHRKMLKDMKMKDDIEPGTTHNITVVLEDEKTRQPITDAKIGIKLVDPSNQSQTKNMKYESAMKSYDAYFDLKKKGRYQIMILAVNGDRKHAAGINYDLK
jgi:hypothetical protein